MGWRFDVGPGKDTHDTLVARTHTRASDSHTLHIVAEPLGHVPGTGDSKVVDPRPDLNSHQQETLTLHIPSATNSFLGYERRSTKAEDWRVSDAARGDVTWKAASG